MGKKKGKKNGTHREQNDKILAKKGKTGNMKGKVGTVGDDAAPGRFENTVSVNVNEHVMDDLENVEAFEQENATARDALYNVMYFKRDCAPQKRVTKTCFRVRYVNCPDVFSICFYVRAHLVNSPPTGYSRQAAG